MMDTFYVLLLGLAVSMDSFAAGVAYGIKSIRIPWTSLAIVGLITGACTLAATILANYLGSSINTHLAISFGSLLLIAIGAWNILNEYITKSNLSPNSSDNKLTFRIGRIVINIMADPETADIDHSKSISSSEATFLGLALGIDNMIAAFAASLIKPLPLHTPVIMGLIQIGLITFGSYGAARFVPEEIKKRFPYVPGTILILLGLFRLV
ncbi:MAG TPA: manganese efflux pump [Methylomusa anaerophila]|uniref:Manganese efflux pump MntP n=1 Tax=Methylomusa anaerophila TaxID=1930071 RepID=A0A348AHK2_9FIRM|nr:manganese efflux pump [Methylomusa anaerophila]BBB90550.1 manganese efflux pump MntP [Methylomusa anaerophila]HML88844.1 manganese efflux pump [Methylomusa anaerophila]